MLWALIIWVLGIPAHSMSFSNVTKWNPSVPEYARAFAVFSASVFWPVTMGLALLMVIVEYIDKGITKWRRG